MAGGDQWGDVIATKSSCGLATAIKSACLHSEGTSGRLRLELAREGVSNSKTRTQRVSLRERAVLGFSITPATGPG